MVVANYVALLPGGHKEAYFFVGMPLVVASTCGLFGLRFRVTGATGG